MSNYIGQFPKNIHHLLLQKEYKKAPSDTSIDLKHDVKLLKDSFLGISEDDCEKIKSQIKHFEKSWNENKCTDLEKLYVENNTISTNHKAKFINIFADIFTGKECIQKRHVEILHPKSGLLKESYFKTTEITFIKLNETAVDALVSWELDNSILSAPGESASGILKHTFVKVGSQWLIATSQNTKKINKSFNFTSTFTYAKGKKIDFSYRPKSTNKNVFIFRLTNKENYIISKDLLQSYFVTRNSIFNSYHGYSEEIKKSAPEILDKKKQQQYIPMSVLEAQPLFQFSIKAGLGIAKSWKTGLLNDVATKCYIASHENNQIGYVQFCDVKGLKTFPDFVYVAQLGVDPKWQRKGLGMNLMLKVLNSYRPRTQFIVLTRRFNDAAKNLYENNLNFIPFTESEENIIDELDYDKKFYCGFKYLA